MGVHSGKFGVINGMSTARNWQITDDITNPKYVASNTQGGTGRISGIESWQGSFGYYGAIPPVMPGDIFAFAGYTAPDNDTLAGTGTKATGNAIVDSIAITWNWGNGDIISQVCNFSGHLGLAWADAQAALSDATAPDAPTICGTKIEYSDDGAAWTELTDCLQATLTLSAANTAYVNSSTSCTTGRKAGIIDWTAAITRQDTKKILSKGDSKYWRFYTDSNSYFLLKWGKVKGFTNFNVDIETGNIISHVMNLEMNGVNAGVIGSIRVPDAVADWWPA